MLLLVFLFNSHRIPFIFFLLLLSISLYGDDGDDGGPIEMIGPRFNAGAPSPYYPTEHLTGDWKGARSFLADHGFTLSPYYYIEVVGNPIGGKKRGIAQSSWMGADIGFDFEKMAGWCGWTIFNSWVFLFGNNLSTTKIGNDFWVQSLFYIETVLLDSLFIKKSFDDIGLKIKIGRIHEGDDFATSALYQYYINISIDANPLSILYNTTFTVQPIAVWGGYVEYQPWDFLIGKFGVYDANVNEIVANVDHGMNFSFKSQEGIIFITEWDYMLGNSPGSKTWPGTYKIGALYQTGKDDPFSGELFGFGPVTVKEVTNNYNIYATMEQIIYYSDNIDVSLFGTFVYGPPSKTLFPYFYSLGVLYQGFPFRRGDVLAFAFARGEYSSELRKIEVEDGMRYLYKG